MAFFYITFHQVIKDILNFIEPLLYPTTYEYSVLLTLSLWRPLSYGNQCIDLQSKLMDWFLYDNELGHERVKVNADLKIS